jgi:hypothetical protein
MAKDIPGTQHILKELACIVCLVEDEGSQKSPPDAVRKRGSKRPSSHQQTPNTWQNRFLYLELGCMLDAPGWCGS